MAYTADAQKEIGWEALLKHDKASQQSFLHSFLLMVKDNPQSFQDFVSQVRRERFPDTLDGEELEVKTSKVFTMVSSQSRECHRYVVRLWNLNLTCCDGHGSAGLVDFSGVALEQLFLQYFHSQSCAALLFLMPVIWCEDFIAMALGSSSAFRLKSFGHLTCSGLKWSQWSYFDCRGAK